MKAVSAHQRTDKVLSELRRTVIFLNLTAEGLRDELNLDYLHETDKVKIETVKKWLSENPVYRPAIISSESVLAIKEFIADNQ